MDTLQDASGGLSGHAVAAACWALSYRSRSECDLRLAGPGRTPGQVSTLPEQNLVEIPALRWPPPRHRMNTPSPSAHLASERPRDSWDRPRDSWGGDGILEWLGIVMSINPMRLGSKILPRRDQGQLFPIRKERKGCGEEGGDGGDAQQALPEPRPGPGPVWELPAIYTSPLSGRQHPIS